MSDFDPIDIEFAMNSEELLQELAAAQGGFSGFDQSVLKSKDTFSDYVKEKLQAQGVIQKNIDLTNAETQQLNDAIDVLYNYHESLGKLAKVDMSQVFSPAELEALENQLNSTSNEFEELAVLVDFLQAKFEQMSPDAEGYEALGHALKSVNQIITIDELDAFNEVLEENEDHAQNLSSKYNALVKELARMKLEGEDNTEEFDHLAQKAAHLKEIISLTNQEIKEAGAEGFEPLIEGLENVALNLELAKTKSTALGLSNEALEKTLHKVHGAIGLLTGLQQVLLKVKNADNTVTKAQITLQKLYAFVVGKSTGALKVFRLALASTGIGLLIIAIGELIAHWDEVERFFTGTSEAVDKMQGKTTKFATDSIANYRRLRAEYKELGDELKEKEEFVDDNKSAFEELGIKVENVSDAEKVFINDTDVVVQALYLRAEAAANAELAMEKFKEAEEKELQAKYLFENDDVLINWWNEVDEFFTGTNPIADLQEEVLDARKEANEYVSKQAELLKEIKEKLQAAGLKVFDEGEERRLREAERLRKKLEREAERERKRREREARKAFRDKIAMLTKIADIERELQKSVMNDYDRGLADIKDKYDKLWAEIKAKNIQLSPKDQQRIKNAQTFENAVYRYKDSEKKLQERLDNERDMYEILEQYRTKVGKEEADKRFSLELQEFANFGERLKSEIERLNKEIQNNPNNPLNALREQTIENLQQQLSDFENLQAENNRDEFAEAYQSAITHQERLQQIEKDYLNRKKQINKIADVELREQKLQALERQKNDAINAANAEAFEKTEIYKKLSQTLVGLTRKEMQQRIVALRTYLDTAKNLTTAQRRDLESQLSEAQNLLGRNDNDTRKRQLLQERERIMAAINSKQAKSNEQVRELTRLLAIVNGELDEMEGKELQDFSNKAAQLGGAFQELGASLESYDEGLADTVGTMGELLGVASDVAGAAASFASGDIVGGITQSISAISKIFSIGARARESERQAREEIARFEKEMFEAQIAFNAQLRERILNEVRINDLYKSRVENIREEMAAMGEQKASVLRDMDAVWERLLGSNTIVDRYTEKYGGFLGIGRKTRVVDVEKSIAEVLGLGSYEILDFGLFEIEQFIPEENIEMTDELLDRLEAINAEQPLTGDAADAFRQLQQLRDEYGSIEEAQRQLEKALKDAVTGTTAQALADSIREGILQGKSSFADFADDIETFLRNAIIAGMSAEIIEPQIQELQDLLYEMMGDGVLTEEERAAFQEMYVAIAEQAGEYLDMINEAGIDIYGNLNATNDLEGAVRGMTEQQAELLAGQFGGLRLAQLETNAIMNSFGSALLEQLSRLELVQGQIELNTRRTADNTALLPAVNDTLTEIKDVVTSNNNAARNGGY